MNKNSLMVAFITLVIGLGVGVLGTYAWLDSGWSVNGRSHLEEHDDEHDQHDEDDQHGQHGHDDEVDQGLIRLTPAAWQEFGIEVREASAGQIDDSIKLPGEIALNADKMAHIVPRVAGIVERVYKRLGDEVKLGEVMAVLESRELSEAKAGYLAAAQRLSLAEATFARSEKLLGKGILPELDFLAVRKERDEAQIRVRAAEHTLHALGLTSEEVAGVSQEADSAFSRYELRAPFAGTVIKKHITLGEVVTGESDVFLLADLGSVWVNIAVYQKDLGYVKEGMTVSISAGTGMPSVDGVISYLAPVVDEKTRTALARVVLPNPDGRWRPGLFATTEIPIQAESAAVVVPKSAIQRLGQESVVFVDTGDGLKSVRVSLGRSNASQVEVLSGLAVGQRYVVRGAFELKAKVATSGLDAHAGHGH